jgi:hypothetical protein
MKKHLFILLALTLGSLYSVSAKEKERPTAEKTITTDGYFTSLSVSDDVTIILTNQMGNELIVSGAEDEVDMLYAEVEDGRLYIGTRAGWKKTAITVYVPARLLSSVEVNGNAVVKSQQTLNINKLDLKINGPCLVDVKVTGKIDVSSSEDYEYRIQRKQ